MEYNETELVFLPGENSLKSSGKRFSRTVFEEAGQEQAEVLGIKVRIGNRPLVYSFTELLRQSGKSVDAAKTGNGTREHYLVVHAISAIRTQGRAKVDELQYFATSPEPAGIQTIDLVPKTRFNEVLNAGINFSGTLGLSGGISLDLPAALNTGLLPDFIELAEGMRLQLSASADLVGRFTYSVQLPVVQSGGIGSNGCTWILNPDEKKTPLLGDQLLVQSISVPAGSRHVRYKLSATIKADKGIFWKQQVKSTPEYTIDVKLDDHL